MIDFSALIVWLAYGLAFSILLCVLHCLHSIALRMVESIRKRELIEGKKRYYVY